LVVAIFYLLIYCNADGNPSKVVPPAKNWIILRVRINMKLFIVIGIIILLATLFSFVWLIIGMNDKMRDAFILAMKILNTALIIK
jgi:hypothetical protein